MRDYELSVASRFWGVPPYELEKREDKQFWIVRALTIKSAENTAQEIQEENARVKAKLQRGGKR